MGRREPESIEKIKKKKLLVKFLESKLVSGLISGTLSLLIAGYFLAGYLEPLFEPKPDFEIECYAEHLSNPYVIIRNKGNLAAKNVGLYIQVDQKNCSFTTSELSAFLFDNISVSWYYAPTNVPYLPSPGYFDTYIQQKNWPTNLELYMKCEEYPLITEITIGGDNFKATQKRCELKISKTLKEIWEK